MRVVGVKGAGMLVGGHCDHSLPFPHYFCPPCCTPNTETCAWKEKEAAKGHLRFTAASVDIALCHCISQGPEEREGGAGRDGTVRL